MNQLTVKELKRLLGEFPDNAKIFLGDDEELNGVHGAYFVQKENADFMSQISWGNIKKGGVLIS